MGTFCHHYNSTTPHIFDTAFFKKYFELFFEFIFPDLNQTIGTIVQDDVGVKLLNT